MRCSRCRQFLEGYVDGVHTCQPNGAWAKGIKEGYQNAIDDVYQYFINNSFAKNTALPMYLILEHLDNFKKGKSDESINRL